LHGRRQLLAQFERGFHGIGRRRKLICEAMHLGRERCAPVRGGTVLRIHFVHGLEIAVIGAHTR
jgi:hypothetical protein